MPAATDLKLLVDMNLSPDWVAAFQREGWDAVHWSAVGVVSADDQTILDWARANGHTIFTQDLDFGQLLATSGADLPSVILLRARNNDPAFLGTALVEAIRRYQSELEAGALLVFDLPHTRVRALPLKP
jgi:predicted nuclease of predicted toxin-antitoxin system